MAFYSEMKAYSHPAVSEIPLYAVMQALSDPCRIAIVRELLDAEGSPLACNEVKLNVCKATRSHHFEVLRAAGIIHTETRGTKCLTSLRKKELNQHFPGLLKMIASAREGSAQRKAQNGLEESGGWRWVK